MKEVGSTLKRILRYQNHPAKFSSYLLKYIFNMLMPKFVAVPMISSVTGAVLDGTEVNGDYWESNLTGTVSNLNSLL